MTERCRRLWEGLIAVQQHIGTKFKSLVDRFQLGRGSPLRLMLTVVLCWSAYRARMAIGPVEMGLQYVTFFPAVTIAAVMGGYQSAMLASLIGMACGTFIFTIPYNSVSLLAFQNALWPNLVFLVDCSVVTITIETMHRYRLKYERELAVSQDRHADLHEKTKYLRTILDNLFTYASLLDVDGRVLEVNNAPLARAGLTREDVIGKYFHDAPWWTYDPDVRAQLIAAMESARRGNVVRYDVDVAMGDDLLPIDFQVAPIKDDRGIVTGLIPTAVDISKRKQAELLSRRHKMMIDQAYDVFMVVDLAGNVVEVNFAFTLMTGFAGAEAEKMHVSQIDANEDGKAVQEHMAQIIVQGHHTFETQFRHKDGPLIDVEVSVTFMGETQQFFSVVRDITEQKKVEEERRIASATFETHDAIMVTDADANILRVNKAFQRITGYSAQEVIGENPRILKSGRHDPAFYQDMWQHLMADGMWQGEVWDRRKSGQIYPKWASITALKNASGQITEYVSIFRDITDSKQAEDEIRNLAFYDSLTSLPNRRLLLDRFQVALAASERNGQYGAVLFLDMDRFKVLNDTLGHNCGDQMLIEVADRIRYSVRDVDTVARLGGDEFVVVFENLGLGLAEASQKVAQIAEKIRTALVVPFMIQGHMHHSSPSIGVCLFQGQAVSADHLLKHADTAMYLAKNSGRNTVRFFDPTLQQAAEARATLESELRQAVAGQQFSLYYQVQFAEGNRPIGAEALIRWHHPTRGVVSPLEFIPLAEESSLILDIGNWVLSAACEQLAKWSRTPSTRHLVLAVNVSGKQFRSSDFVAYVQSLILHHRITPCLLKLELTESVILDDISDVVGKMCDLKNLGVQLSLDDFGTGYSSLSYLKRLPLDQIKIDRSFIRDVVIDGNDALMVKAIIDMAKNFHMHVIAEGVENQEQLSFLEVNGCKNFQGYFFSEPIPLDQFERLILNATPA